ncbi:zinc finger protein 638-like isoform X1 [Xyrauchen texanus]|uniref:zinc finger protein 638-like isoform X1 n=1 Tax=Xyrauchen texanus TaxID=154827 RepID=UPI002242B1FE|nr:zinc finger protein 638-like isoform X1 [Xyrauchen texanus]
MSHPFYNPRGGTFPNSQRPIVHGQYGSLGSQPGLELGASRLGPGSMSTSRGGLMVNQQMPFALGQHQSQISQDLEAAIDRNIMGAREEVRRLSQILQQPKIADPRLRKDTRDEGLSSGRTSYPGTGGSSRSNKADWSLYQAPSKPFASSSLDRSSCSTQEFQYSGFGGSGASSSLDSQPPPEQRLSRYTPENVSNILANFGLSKEDLELLSHCPEDQLTLDNLPVVLHEIRMRKANRNIAEIDARSEFTGSDPRHGKVIDYGHFSKFGYPEESGDGYASEHLPKASPKYGREVSGPPFSGMGITKRPQPCQAASGPARDPRPTKPFPARPSASQFILPSSSRPPSQMMPQLGVLPLNINDISGGPSSKWIPFLSSPISAPASKRLPTPTMMKDYAAATPRIFPHTCSLCIIECVQIKDWLEHQNTNLHIEHCRLLRKQYPDWNVEAVSVSRPEPKSEYSSLKRRTRSHSYSRSPSPKRHHDSSSRRERSRSPRQDDARERVATAYPSLRGFPVRDFPLEQKQDETLRDTFSQVKVIDGQCLQPGLSLSYPYFSIIKDLLYRVTQDSQTKEDTTQLLTPQSRREMLFQTAHCNPMAGHLGQEKTLNRLMVRFYWPGIRGDVRRWCAACRECQLVNPPASPKAPLHLLPLTEVPFERIGMDLVGPLERTARGHRFVLVLVDYATRYPEAVPLRNISVRSVAEALLKIISRVGIPKEILTDQGTTFMSRTLRELYKLLGIKSIQTSVCHPQMDGLVEQFHQTLKSVIFKFVHDDAWNWDKWLEPLLFAVREVPQASTGFSPFELLYGRRPRSVLDVLRENLEEGPSNSKNEIQYILDLRAKLHTLGQLSQENLLQAQERQSRLYNKDTQLREFTPGDKVLALLPTSSSKLLAKWQGPFEITRRVGEIDYEVKRMDRGGARQIYHLNLLKPWREAVPVTLAKVVPEDEEAGAEQTIHTQSMKVKGAKASPVTKPPEKPSDPKKSVQTAKAKPPAKGSERPVTKKIENEAIPWRKNIVEISDLPEEGVTEDELTKFAKPYGLLSTPVIAITQKRAFLQMLNTETAEAMVKACSETPAKIQEKPITVKMMMQPINLYYAESLFRVLVGMEKSPTLPERLLIVKNVPKTLDAVKEVETLIQRHGTYKKHLPLNGRVIFEMESAANARKAYIQLLKIRSMVQNNLLAFQLAKPIKVNKKPQAKGAKPPGKSAATEGKPNTIKAQSPAAAATTASRTDGAATSEATPTVGNVSSAQDNMTAVPHITTDKVAPTDTDIMTEGEEITAKSTSDSEVKLEADSVTAATGNVEITAAPNDMTVDISSNAETSTPEMKEMDTHNDAQTDNETVMMTPDTDSVKAKIEVGSSIISSEFAVADESEKAELELASLGLLEEPAVLVEPVNVKHELDTPVSTTESAVSIDTADQNKVSPVDNQNIPKDEVISKELVLRFVEDKEKLAKDSDVELKSEMEVVATTVSSGETQMEVMETQSQEELANIPQQIDDHKPTEPFESEINTQPSDQIQPGEKIVQAATASDAIPSSDPSTSDQTASNSPQIVPPLFDDMRVDFPTVTQEILKELTVHQCHMPSSLKHAEQEAKKKAEAEKKAAEKTTNNVPSSSKKPPSSDKADKAVKKATQSDRKSVLSEKEKKPQNSRTRSRKMDTLFPEIAAAANHRSRGNSEDSPSRHSTPPSGSSSRKSRRKSSPPSKRSRGHVDDRRSHSKSSQPSRSHTKTSKIEKAKEEETKWSEEPFPFNIDEFVTVDEVGDDTEETVTLSSESLAKDEKVQDDPSALSTISSNAKSTPANEPKQKSRSRSTTYKTRSSETKDPKVIDTAGKIETKSEETMPVAEVVESQKQKENEPQEESMDNQLEPVAVKPAVVESESTELYTPLGSSAPAEENPSFPTQTFSSTKESTGIEPTQPVSSSPVQKEDCQTTSTKKLEKSENGNAEQSETSAPDMEDKDEATMMSDLPSRDAMVTLDEVSEGEEDFPEAADEEQHSMAEEVPETILTVNEVVDEETGGEEYQLEKELQGLVTLDEIVEEEEELDSFNPETLVTLDEAKGDGDEIEEVEQSEPKFTSPNFKTPPRPEEPEQSPSQEEDAYDLEEFCSMNFVTVDEVGEEEEEQPPSEEVKVQEAVKKTATRAKKRARQTPVKRSTRGKRDAAKSDKESDEPETSAEGEPAPTASKPESPPSAPDPVELDEPDSQKAETMRVPDSSSTEIVSSGSDERNGDKVDDYSESERAVVEMPVADKKTTIKEESKQRRETEMREEPEAKKVCSQFPVIEDFTLPPYSPDNPIGADFVVPKMGFFCRLCSLFYENEETAKKSHCGSLRHYQNMEKYYKKLKSQQQRGKSTLTTSSQSSASE